MTRWGSTKIYSNLFLMYDQVGVYQNIFKFVFIVWPSGGLPKYIQICFYCMTRSGSTKIYSYLFLLYDQVGVYQNIFKFVFIVWPGGGLPKYIQTKVLTNCFCLIQNLKKQAEV